MILLDGLNNSFVNVKALNIKSLNGTKISELILFIIFNNL